MNGIVNYNLQKAQPVSLSTGYKEQADPFLEMLPSAINSLAKAGAQYAEDASKAAAAGRVADYEKAVAELAASAETLEMTDVQKTQALERINANHSDVPANERNAIDNRYTSLSVAKDTVKKREEAIVQAQIDYDKALDKDFQQRFPTWAVTMTPEERVSKSKELTFKAGLLADMITNPDIKQTDPIFQDTLTDLELMDIKNWLEGAKASMGGEGAVVKVANLADVQHQLTQKIGASGVDIRLASQTSDIVFAPLIKAAETYSKTAEIALKDIDKSLELNMSPGYRYVSQHADMLAWVDSDVKRQFDIATANLLANGSVTDSLMYQGGLTKLDGNSFSLGFTQLSGASRNDSPLQSFATMNIGSNVEKQNANLITGTTDSNLPQKSDAVANMSPADRLNAIANDRGLLEAYNIAYNEYALSTDPDVRRAAKDHMIEKLQNSLAYATGMVKSDVKGFWTHAYQVKWEDNKVKLLDSDGNDITNDYWIAGNPQRQLKNNVQQIEEVAKNMLRLGATQSEIDNAMNQVINESVGANGRFESIGTAEDWGSFGKKYYETMADVEKKVSDSVLGFYSDALSGPARGAKGVLKAIAENTRDSYAAIHAGGPGYETPIDFGRSSDVTPAAQKETQSAEEPGILDKAGEASLELFRLAGEGAEDIGNRVLKLFDNDTKFTVDGREYSTIASAARLSGQKKEVVSRNLKALQKADINKTLTDSDKVRMLVTMSFEDFKAAAYDDGTGRITIGYGTNLNDTSQKNKEYLNSIAPDGYAKAKKGLLQLTEEQAAVLAMNSYQDAKDFFANTSAKTALGTSLKDVYANANENVRSILLDLRYNLRTEGLVDMKNFFKALENKDYVEAAVELADSKYLTDVGVRSRKNIAALIMTLPNQKEAWQRVRQRLEEKGKQDIIRHLENNSDGQQEIAKLLSPSFAEVFPNKLARVKVKEKPQK